MKGLTGLIVAGVLGLLGIALNWFYLENKAKNLQTVSFLGIKENAGIEVGDVVTLPTRVGEPLVAPVEGRPKFRGQIGRQGTALGFQVTDLVES